MDQIDPAAQAAHEKALRAAYEATEEFVEKNGLRENKDFAWLANIQYALYCVFSEEGTTTEQEELLRKAGLPCRQ